MYSGESWISDVTAADIHAQCAGLDPRYDAALAVSGLCAVAGLDIAAQGQSAFFSAANLAGIGGRDDDWISAQRGVDRQAEHVIDTVSLAVGHDLGSAIMPVAADGDAGTKPVAADMAHHPDVPRRLFARSRLACAEQHRHRSARYHVQTMDRQQPGLPRVHVSEQQLLIGVHDVAGVIDI